MTSKTGYIDKKASKKEWNFYWVFPYYKNADGKMIVGQTGKYVYGKAKWDRKIIRDKKWPAGKTCRSFY